MKRRKPITRSRVQEKSNKKVQKIVGGMRKVARKLAAWIDPVEHELRTARERQEKRDEEFARTYHSVERVEWMQQLPSIISGERPCVNAHVRGGGMARKGDYIWIVPLTDAEHRELHRVGKQTFERKHGIDLDIAAGTIEHAWRQHQRGLLSRVDPAQ